MEERDIYPRSLEYIFDEQFIESKIILEDYKPHTYHALPSFFFWGFLVMCWFGVFLLFGLFLGFALLGGSVVRCGYICFVLCQIGSRLAVWALLWKARPSDWDMRHLLCIDLRKRYNKHYQRILALHEAFYPLRKRISNRGLFLPLYICLRGCGDLSKIHI